MAMHVKAPSGSWVQPSAAYVQDGGAWRRVTSLRVKDGEIERPYFHEFYSYDPTISTGFVSVSVSTPSNGPVNVSGHLVYPSEFGGNVPIFGQVVTLWADDELVQSDTTKHAGAFQFSWDPPTPGVYDLRVEYAGAGDYAPSSYEIGNRTVTGTATISVTWPSMFPIGEPVTLRPKVTSPMSGVDFSGGTMVLQRDTSNGSGLWSTVASGTWNGDGWDVTWTAGESMRGSQYLRLQLTGIPYVDSPYSTELVEVEFEAPPPANLIIQDVTTYYTYFSIGMVPGVARYEVYCPELGTNVFTSTDGSTQYWKAISTSANSVYTFTVVSVSATGQKTTGNSVRVSTVHPPSWSDVA